MLPGPAALAGSTHWASYFMAAGPDLCQKKAPTDNQEACHASRRNGRGLEQGQARRPRRDCRDAALTIGCSALCKALHKADEQKLPDGTMTVWPFSAAEGRVSRAICLTPRYRGAATSVRVAESDRWPQCAGNEPRAILVTEHELHHRAARKRSTSGRCLRNILSSDDGRCALRPDFVWPQST
jgi:hypothetical protein